MIFLTKTVYVALLIVGSVLFFQYSDQLPTGSYYLVLISCLFVLGFLTLRLSRDEESRLVNKLSAAVIQYFKVVVFPNCTSAPEILNRVITLVWKRIVSYFHATIGNNKILILNIIALLTAIFILINFHRPYGVLDMALVLIFILLPTIGILYQKSAREIFLLTSFVYVGLVLSNVALVYAIEKKLDFRDKYIAYEELNVQYDGKVYPWSGVFVPDIWQQTGTWEYTILANLSKSRILFCNEDGEWRLYDSDRYGFNNDDKAHDQDPKITLIGDSFTEGMCVDRKSNLQGQLKKFGVETINLGMSGTSPLEQLAIFKEYLPENTHKVVWVWAETNDLHNLNFRINDHPFTKGNLPIYLDEAFSNFGLKNKVPYLDAAIKKQIKSFTVDSGNIHNWAQGNFGFRWKSPSTINDHLVASRIRQIIYDLVTLKMKGRTSVSKDRTVNPEFPLGGEVWFEDHEPVFIRVRDVLEQIFSAANKEAKRKNIEMYFVYNPMYATIGPVTNYIKPFVLELAGNYFAKVVDLEPFLDKYNDTELFPLGREGHYSEDGYKILADILVKELPIEN
jgi:hypothetical protein